ncbi:hypothetical protein IX51_04250 [uncultured archaeon]|nr:hypothetical protein IX51_04250 [uncultured archaeon]HKJ97118.1 MBL fold metallo-hydrolase [Thermoplasmataceae archaeon]
MKFGSTEIELLADGSFTLEVGACFGVVPRKIWSRVVKENENNRVRMALNIPLIKAHGWSALIDTGVGSRPDERMKKIYEIEKETDLMRQVENSIGQENVDYIVHSHLHFDHMGHSFETADGRVSFPNAVRVAQKDEYHNFRNTNEVTRGSYLSNVSLDGRFNMSEISGSVRIRDGLRVVKTGGHTSGHQAIIYENGGKGLIYFGDIVPSTFNLKLPYITAIDTFPLDTLEMKKSLFKLAIEKQYVCVFNHDSQVKTAYLKGDVNNIEIEPVEL